MKPTVPAPTPEAPEVRERRDPFEMQRPTPWVMPMLIGAMAMWGVYFVFNMQVGLDSRYGDQRTPAALMPADAGTPGQTDAAKAAVDGALVYASKCAACHQASGLGIPAVFPPLAASEWVTGSDKVLVQIPLHGVAGGIDVKGATYQGAMPSFSTLSDEEIAAVLTHVRSQWGNQAPPVTASTVKQGREASKARTTPWSNGDEIRQGAAP
jgi:mono/diheme cytochrome c family protein